MSEEHIQSENLNTVVEERYLFVADDIYKSIQFFQEQIPGLPQYVYEILFLRYNRQLLQEDEVRQVERNIVRHRDEMKHEYDYYQKLFEANKENLIVCSEEESKHK